MIRTVNFTKVIAKGVTLENGEINSVELEPYIYTGRKMSQVALEKAFKEQNTDKQLQSVVIISETTESKKYEISLADFMEKAKEVDETATEQNEQVK